MRTILFITSTLLFLSCTNSGADEIASDFSPEGKYLTHKVFKSNIYAPGCIWKNNRFYTVGNDENDLPVVRIYKIIWKNGMENSN